MSESASSTHAASQDPPDAPKSQPRPGRTPTSARQPSFGKRPPPLRAESLRPDPGKVSGSDGVHAPSRRSSMAPSTRRLAKQLDGDEDDLHMFESRDDEHRVQDRGEALIRKRMKERKREKTLKQKGLHGDLSNSYAFGSARDSTPSLHPQSSEYHPDSYPSPTSTEWRGGSVHDAGERRASQSNAGYDDEEDAPDASSDSEPGDSGDGHGGDVSYTLKDRQDAINFEHPFGLPIWKPALYKKSRSLTRTTDSAIKSLPGQDQGRGALPGNICWFLFFGIWTGLLCFVLAALLRLVPRGGLLYSRVLYGLGTYLLWPFGNYVEVECTHKSGDRHGKLHAHHIHEHDLLRDEGGARQGVENEGTLLLPEHGAPSQASYGTTEHDSDDDSDDGEALTEQERIASESGLYHYVYDDSGRDIGLGKRWVGIVVYSLFYGLVLFPVLGSVCLLCWGLIFPIPMAKLTWVLLKNLAVQPLAMHFRSPWQIDTTAERVRGSSKSEAAASDGAPYALRPGQIAPQIAPQHRRKGTSKRRSMVLLCNYRAVGKEYVKYTVGGVNILFIDTLPIVFFTILLFFVVRPHLQRHGIEHGLLPWLASDSVLFVLSLLSVLPLSYFIGMAVASISTQSSIGMGAVINATFGSIIELVLYSIALVQGRAGLVEGSLVGSLLAGVLLMPGTSMCSGALRRKEQKFNARSAGVTSTMLIMAIIGILTPTIFFQIYGTFELECRGCPTDVRGPQESWKCTQCSYEHLSPVNDPFFQSNVKGLIYTCAVILTLAYCIGLWFSLRTHASHIWSNIQTTPTAANALPDHLPPPLHRASVYKRMMSSQMWQQLLPTHQAQAMDDAASDRTVEASGPSTGSLDQRRSSAPSEPAEAARSTPAPSGSGGDSHRTPPSRAHADVPLRTPAPPGKLDLKDDASVYAAARMFHYLFSQGQPHEVEAPAPAHESVDEGGGHDAPSWSRMGAVSVLLACTVLYAIISEILVDVVDVVVKGFGLPEKFIGVTIFALVPNTTEFMNAMSFATNGNIALSMEIGSAYALQVCLIQIPAMVWFSAWYNARHTFPPGTLEDHIFTLIFPRWDIIAIILSIFLLTYTYIEARSNYHRGSILILAYLVFVAGFYFAPVHDPDSFVPDVAGQLQTWRMS